ncbi:MAG: hypothetical protein LBO74_13860 [Candidatus Symbiothrix sp.]|jgi:hypothetical protein|nr:hypothetical protein [Candidatus Symbiothrix sp.]
MLYTRNAFIFRKFYKEEVAREQGRLDLNFVGSLHPDKSRKETGFSKLIYGNREDLGKLLSTIALNVAADDQAIYELIQNADDCESSFFSVNYNEKYLLCINNGNYFSDQDMSAIINVAGNYKDGEDIGTFGIGFKILHRLVGKDDGREAIINDYAGPIIFSWKEYGQFVKFLKGEPIGVYGWADTKEEYTYEKDKENAWLIKLLYTCFPTNIGERIKLKDFDTQEVKFDKEELKEMREFLKKSLQNVNLAETNNLKSGSIFFLKLGEGKSKFLDDGIDKIKSGLSYSFKFLNSLKKIYINGEEIKAQGVTDYSNSFSIDSPEFIEINPKNKNRDIKFTFAYYRDYRKAEELRNELVPNLYTFFSMDEEKNGFNFLLHCNAFDMNNDRRKLQANSQINEKLLPIIANDITSYIDRQKENNRTLFLSLYANLLISKEPKSKQHINNYFFNYFKDYINLNIPTANSYSDNTNNIKIQNTFLEIDPSDFGCPEIEWFYWNDEKRDKILIEEARKSEKLNLEKWDIINLLKYAISKGKIEAINVWIKEANEKHFADANNKDFTYLSFIQEIDKNISERDLPIISQIKLFKFSDNNYYSLNEILTNSNLALIYDKTIEIKKELRYLGIIVSNLDISKNPNLLKFVLPKISEETLFKAIAEKSKQNNLNAEQKQKLFFALSEFNGVGVEKLKDLELFKDAKGTIRPLRNLLKGDIQVPNWLFPFEILKDEYIPELDKYLVAEKDIYQSIIYNNWDFLIEQKLNIKDFYIQVTQYFQKNSENLRLNKLAYVFTNNGFKKSEQIFFNTNLNNCNFEDLQNAIYKIAGKPTPHKWIFDFLTRDDSPFKIDRNDAICYLIKETVNLSYREIVALLQFAKQNNEEIFRFAYIQKQNEGFLLVRHSQNIFQYYSNRVEIIKLLTNQDSFKLLPKELNEDELSGLGLCYDKGLYMKILQTIEFSENLLPVIKECDKEVQITYLSTLKNLSLQEGTTYDKNSFEHRCLKLAIDCYESNFQTEFAPKILINGTLRIRDIAVKDDINFDEITLSLSSVLPKYKGISDIITKIINQFVDFTKTELSEKVFLISNKNKSEIYTELQMQFPSLQNIEQFAFLLYYSKQSGKNFITDQSITTLSSNDILEFAYKHKFETLNNYINFDISNKVYPSEFALETETLSSFILTWFETPNKQDKLNYLSSLGLHSENSSIVYIRKFFKTGQDLDIQGKIYTFPSNSSLLINTLKWLQNKTFSASESTKLDAIKQIYGRINYTQEIPLLYVQQILENKPIYSLEVCTTTKYYFETPQEGLLQKIFAVLQSKSLRLLELDYCKNWQSVIPNLSKIQLKTELDILRLQNGSEEWDDVAYEQWKINQNHKVFIYNGDYLPYKTTFLDHAIETTTDGTSIGIANAIYISQSAVNDIRTELSKFIKADELIKLYQLDNNNSTLVQTLQDKILQLESQLKTNDQSKQNKYADSEDDFDKKSSFQDDVKEFIRKELENTEWDEYIPELKGLLELSISHSREKQKIYNLVAKLKLAKDRNIHFEKANKDYNHLENGNEKYFVHSARGAFAYIHPKEILQMRDAGYQMALDFSTKTPIKIYETAEEILSLNTNHMLVFQHEKEMSDLFAFCESNRDANKHLLIVDRDNSRNQSSEIFKILNPEDDYR